MTLRVELAEGSLVRIQGPAKVTVLDGSVMVLGALFSRGESFEVAGYRSYALKALTDVKLALHMEPGSSVEPARAGEEVLDKWVYEADRLLTRGCRGFVVIGPTDAGKSSVTALISNRALLRGMRVGIVDADVGQADVGPPGFVSAAHVDRKLLWLRELRAKYMRLVGSITPHRAERRIVAGVVELGLKLRSEGAEVIVVDTDGWFQGLQSLEYKVDMARYLGADAAVAVGVPEDHVTLVDKLFSWLPCGVTFLPSPAQRRTRSREERRELRAEAYRRYLEPRVTLIIDAERVPVHGSCFLAAKPVEGVLAEAIANAVGKERFVAAAEDAGTLYIVARSPVSPEALSDVSKLVKKDVQLIDVEAARNVVVALVDKNLNEIPALIKEVDFAGRRVAVTAAQEVGEVRAVILSSIKLKEDFTEVGKLQRCVA